MKKYTVACAALCMGLFLASCGSSKESAYRKAYEKAKAQEQVNTQERETVTETPVVTPVVETPVVKQETSADDNNYDNVSVRSEKLTVVDGAGLKQFSVVVGAFSVKANALGLQQQLKQQGYEAQVAFNEERNMYRVIASTFDDKGAAVQSRNEFRATYPDAWLLFNN